MTRTSAICICLFLTAILPHTSTAELEKDDQARLEELSEGALDTNTKAIRDRIALEYLRFLKKTADSQLDLIAEDIVTGLEKIQTDFSGVNVTDDSYWNKVETQIVKVIDESDALDTTKPPMKKFFADEIVLLKKQGKNANDGVVLVVGAMKKARGEFYDVHSRLTGNVGNTAATRAAAQINAGSGVPGWYKSMTQRCREYHAKKRELHRQVFGY